MEANIKRYPHSYKCTEQVYKAANKRAKQEKTTLANVLEHWAKLYANGAELKVVTAKIKPAKK